jgi:hypothetical protein
MTQVEIVKETPTLAPSVVEGKTTVHPVGTIPDKPATQSVADKRAERRLKFKAELEKQPTEEKPENEANPIETKPEAKPVESSEPPKVTTEQKEETKLDEKTESHDDRFVQAFTKIQKRERELTQLAKELKERSRKLEDFEKALESQKADPLALLKYAGVTYDDVTKHLLEQPKDDPVLKKLDSVEKTIEKLSKKDQESEAESAKRKYEEAVSAVKKDLNGIVSSDSSKFEACKFFGNESIDIAFNVMDEYYGTNGEALSYEDALTATEEWLQKNRIEPALKYKEQTSKEVQQKEAPAASEKPKKTLSNSLDASPPTGGERVLTRAERRELAKRALKWD